MSEKIKRCPFCNSDRCRISGEEDGAYVECLNCRAEGPFGDFSEAQAIEAWNLRGGFPMPPMMKDRSVV